MASLKIDASQVRGNLRRLQENVPKHIGTALVAVLKIELREVKQRTPRKTGRLRDSERVEGPFVNGRLISASIVAGGPDVPYAAIVHEDLDAYHPVGEAKFIERVLNESAPYVASRIATYLREKLK